MKKVLNLFIFVILCFMASVGMSFAEMISSEDFDSLLPSERYMIEKMANASQPDAAITNVTVNGSIATITTTGNVSQYYVGMENNVNTAYSVNPIRGRSQHYVGVKNGTYYFWVSGITHYTPIAYARAVTVTTSCNNKPVHNVTGTADFEICYVSQNKGEFKPDGNSGDTIASCAQGYEAQPLKVLANTCNSALTTYNGQELKRAYCKKVFRLTCVPSTGGGGNTSGGGGGGSTAEAPTISSMSVSAGSLSPGFTPGNKNYNVSVGGEVAQITIDATATSGSSFVAGFGPRTLNLSYGVNRILVKVANASGSVATYTVNVSRADNRSQVNTLSTLAVSTGTLDPAFSPNVTSYNVFVENNVTSIDIAAVTSDPASYFDEGYGPRTVNLVEGFNEILIKVRSESGKLKAYAINVTRESLSASVCNANAETKALLNKIEFEGFDGEVAEKLTIVKDVFTYNIKVPFDIVTPIINVFPVTDGDTFVVNGVSDLIVGVEQEATIVVTSAECPNISRTYTIGITRSDEIILSDNANISELTIENHKEFKFEPSKHEYTLRLNKKEKKLKISYSMEEEGATCEIKDNENLKEDSKVIIECTAENQIDKSYYQITMLAPKKGAPLILIVLLVIIILFVLAYLILRLLGYKIYFNFSAIGAFFRELKEKITHKE